jgi:hypothetical protein
MEHFLTMRNVSSGKMNKLQFIQAFSSVYLVKEEKLSLKGQQTVVQRVYSQTNDSHKISSVGWVISSDIRSCMICNDDFGPLLHKHHCHACGNVICQRCSPSKAPINGVVSVADVRVCDQCFWGQV